MNWLSYLGIGATGTFAVFSTSILYFLSGVLIVAVSVGVMYIVKEAM